MKIAEIKTYPLLCQLDQPFAFFARLGDEAVIDAR
jgi:hypothetical protein